MIKKMANIKLFIIISAVMLMASYQIGESRTLEEAKQLFNDGDYAEAVGTLMETADKEPKNTSVNHLAGVALQQLGRYEEAKKYLKRGINESNINLAEIAFMEYRFDEGDDYLDQYEKTLKKGKKTAEPSAEAVAARERLEKGRNMLDRVEKIVIIDSLTVDKEDFFRAYRLAASSGSLQGANGLPAGVVGADPTVVYVTENGREKIWSIPDDNENYVLVEASLLDDGKWSEPTELDNRLGEGGDANFPFMLSDGETLYFANDGENSLGGYDIFISRRAADGFFMPQNLGMPYNSPYDDYMLAIDEETGSGWWATDRNQIEDKVTIYRFIPSELRINYPSDTENLADLAFIRNYRATQTPGVDYEQMKREMDQNTRRVRESDYEFTIGLPGGKIYHNLRDFSNPTSRQLMSEYLALEKKLTQEEKRLSDLRQQYRNGRKNVAREIETAESDIESMRQKLKNLKNDIARAEK